MTLNEGITHGWVAAGDHHGTLWIGEPGCQVDPNASFEPGDIVC